MLAAPQQSQTSSRASQPRPSAAFESWPSSGWDGRRNSRDEGRGAAKLSATSPAAQELNAGRDAISLTKSKIAETKRKHSGKLSAGSGKPCRWRARCLRSDVALEAQGALNFFRFVFADETPAGSRGSLWKVPCSLQRFAAASSQPAGPTHCKPCPIRGHCGHGRRACARGRSNPALLVARWPP